MLDSEKIFTLTLHAGDPSALWSTGATLRQALSGQFRSTPFPILRFVVDF